MNDQIEGGCTVNVSRSIEGDCTKRNEKGSCQKHTELEIGNEIRNWKSKLWKLWIFGIVEIMDIGNCESWELWKFKVRRFVKALFMFILILKLYILYS